MRIEELLRAIYQLADQNDFRSATQLVDGFLESASGSDLAKALDAKAQLLMELDPRETPAALAIRERALAVAGEDPGTQAYILVELLRTSRILGDVDRATAYEAASALLLKHHEDHPDVARYRAFLTQNCGRVAQLRGERALALWYFLRAEEAYQVARPADLITWACYRSGNLINLFEEYMAFNRMSEAREALNAARDICPKDRPVSWATVAEHEVEWGLASHDSAHAAQWLQVVEGCQKLVNTPDLEVRIQMLRGWLARSKGDLTRYHQLLSQATALAVRYRLDHLLAEVHRMQRIPSMATN